MKFAAARGTVQIAYDVLGAGAPVVMLHDLGESSGFWYEFDYVKTCLAQGRQVVLVDLHDHGDSESTDPVDYGLIDCCADVVAVLDHAGIRRADFLGYGVGGRIALCIAAIAPDRVHAVAAGGSHPFAERAQLHRDTLLKVFKPSVAQVGGTADVTVAGRLSSHQPAALAIAEEGDWPDIADAVAGCGVPVLLFVGKEDPRYPLVLSFAEQSGAKVIVLPKQEYATTVAATGHAKLLFRILEFLEAPEAPGEALPPCLWSGSWA